jgi:hypothetical protein
MNQIEIMTEETKYWGHPRWRVIEVNAKGTGEGPIVFSPPAESKEGALSQHALVPKRQLRPGRVELLVLAPNTGPIENWLKQNWY